MSINFQQSAEQNSAGSLLLGAIFGGLTSEVGQAIDMASDTAEIASEFHTYHQQKSQQSNFKLGQKNSLNSMFGRKAAGVAEEQPDIQTRYLNMDYKYAPKRAMGMRMAA